MSDISKGLRTYLLSKSAIRESVDNRIHYDFFPAPGKTPAIVIEEITAEHHHQLSGGAGAYDVSVRITVVSADPLKRSVIGNQLRDVLQGLRGTVGSERVESCELRSHDKRADPGDIHGIRQAASKIKANPPHTHNYLKEMILSLVVTESIPTP